MIRDIRLSVPSSMGPSHDISVLGPPGETFYDLTVVSVHASSVKGKAPLPVLDEAAKAKTAKYRAYGKDFVPLVQSSSPWEASASYKRRSSTGTYKRTIRGRISLTGNSQSS
ncbi:hypothetical protein P152DRAFT_460951 [Eremomyces bilateralis CBS 781.70]|uniref:Uncharacterized protein n=1 Tax=Eremomyces bilateralis CBS 781.70 TaxID=1392243 RepID=A0A6G1FVY9_9PEZI|nr:uncharacterized protein P152DRAFT_460951 [Eremomyces bilateralis CBS 781.70]KAF1809850.1 hypothetical protein P152DRAFT_460951 [Eremomyces bilateralis CBS 781.70]